MPTSPDQDSAARQQQAWAVYMTHRGLFEHVLRSTGPWRPDDGLELVHDFLIDRLPLALISYDPTVGPVGPWLARVFANYAKRRRREQASVRRQFQSLTPDGTAGAGASGAVGREPAARSSFTHDSLYADPLGGRMRDQASLDVAVAPALGALPGDLQSVLRGYFGSGPHAGNIRAVARELGLTRYRTRRSLMLALGELATRLAAGQGGSDAPPGGGALGTTGLRACRAFLIAQETPGQIGKRLGRSEDEVDALLRDTLAALSHSAARVIESDRREPAPPPPPVGLNASSETGGIADRQGGCDEGE